MICEIANWTITRLFRSVNPLNDNCALLFSDSIGLKADWINEGYNPASKVMNKADNKIKAAVAGFASSEVFNLMPSHFDNCGSNRDEKNKPRINAPATRSAASPRNWNINCRRVDPSTFLTPTSFALCMACAVARLTKLIEAMMMIKTAIAAST